jgi:hypothetical protein
MDDMTRRQTVPPGNLGIAGFATAELTTFGEQFGPGGPVNRTVNATAAEQRRIRGVDDRVNA